MGPEEFRLALVEETDSLTRRQLGELVADRYLRDGRTNPGDLVSAKAEFEQRLAELGVVEAPSPPQITLPPQPDTEALLLERIAPWADELRESLFDRTEPPFASVEEAQPWLEVSWRSRQEWQPLHDPEAADREYELWSEIERIGEDLRRLTDARLEVSLVTEKAPAWVPEDRRHPSAPWIKLEEMREPDPVSLSARLFTGELVEVPVGPSAGAYYRFGREIARVAEATGFSRIDLSDLVLTGRKPTLPAATITRRPGRIHRGDFHRHLRIRLNAPLKWEELLELHDRIQEAWTEAYDPPPSVRLLLHVAEQELEGADPFARQTWEQIATRLDGLGYTGSTEWRALAMRHDRWKKKLAEQKVNNATA